MIISTSTTTHNESLLSAFMRLRSEAADADHNDKGERERAQVQYFSSNDSESSINAERSASRMHA